MSNYEGFQAKLLQLGQDPSTDTELFARLFIAYKEHESVKEVTADLTKMMIKEEQTVDQEPQTPTSGLVLKDNENQSPATPGHVSIVKSTGKYIARRYDKVTKKILHLGTFGTEEEAVQALAVFDADGTKLQITSSKYKGVSFNKNANKWTATREYGHLAEKKHIGTFNTEDEAGKAVKESGSFKEFYDEHYPDL